MSTIEEVIDILRKDISKSRKKVNKNFLDATDQLFSHLILLKSSTLSREASTKLANCFRQTFAPVYTAFLLPALQVVSAIFHEIYHEKILPALGKQQLEQKLLWETVLDALLSGVLDFLENSEDDKSKNSKAKDAIASALYSAVCDICFSLTAPMMSVDLRCTAYNLLSDSAAMHAHNKHKLRDNSVLGGERIGSIIWRTKDYLVLESLLTLFAHLIPSSKSSPSGRPNSKRMAFIRSVFVSSQPPEVTGAGHKVAELLDQLPSANWDEASKKIMEELASLSLVFPQPFVMKEVDACGQLKQVDGLYVDDKAFVMNVLTEDEQCETLSIPYSTVLKIECIREREAEGNGIARICMRVATPPILGKEAIVKESAHDKDQGGHSVNFTIQSDCAERFVKSLIRRGLSKRLKDIVPPKLSLAKSPTLLDFDSQGNPVKEPSQSERIENVEQFYHTNQSSDDLVSNAGVHDDIAQFASAVETPRTREVQSVAQEGRKETKSEISLVNTSGASQSSKAHLLMDDDPVSPKIINNPNCTAPVPARPTQRSLHSVAPLRRTRSQKIRDQVFGASDEELSEISDIESVPPSAQVTLAASPIPMTVSSDATRMPAKASTASLNSAAHARGTIGKTIVDSDEGDAPHTEPGSLCRPKDAKKNIKARKKRAAIVVDSSSEDEGKDASVAQPVTPSTFGHRSVLPPVTPTKSLSVSRGRDIKATSSMLVPTADAPMRSGDPSSETYASTSKKTPAANQSVNMKSPQRMSAYPVDSAVAADSLQKAVLDTSRSGKSSNKTCSSAVSAKSATRTVGFDLSANAIERPPQSLTTSALDVSYDADNLDNLSVPVRKARHSTTNGLNHSKQLVNNAGGTMQHDPADVSDHISDGSSPVPVVKSKQKSIKSSLRKKNETPIIATKNPARVSPSKRKRVLSDDIVQDLRSSSNLIDDTGPPPTKRPRTADGSGASSRAVIPSERTESQVLRPRATAAVRATKKYRGKKEKASSPCEAAEPVDQLPASSPLSAKTARRKEKSHDRVGGGTSLMASEARPIAKKDKENQLLGPVQPTVKAPIFDAQSAYPQASCDGLAHDDIVEEQEVDGILTKTAKATALLGRDKATSGRGSGAPQKRRGRKESDRSITKKSGAAIEETKTDHNNKTKIPTSLHSESSLPVENVATKLPGESTNRKTDHSRQAQPAPKPHDTRLSTITDQQIYSAHDSSAEVHAIGIEDDITEPRTPQSRMSQLRRKEEPKSVRKNLPRPDAATGRHAIAPPNEPLETIDLTLDESPPKLGEHRRVNRDKTPPRSPAAVNPGAVETSTPHRHAALSQLPLLSSPSKGTRPRHSVTFAPTVEERPISPLKALDTYPNAESNFMKKTRDIAVTPSPILRKSAAHQKHNVKTKMGGGPQTKNVQKGQRGEMQDIVDVLQDLQQAIMQKINRRFEGVREEVRAGRDAILAEAAADLLEMRSESVSHFNRLIDLEAEYAAFGRAAAGGLEDMLKMNQGICGAIEKTVEGLDRGSLSKKMPASLAVFPASVQK